MSPARQPSKRPGTVPAKAPRPSPSAAAAKVLPAKAAAAKAAAAKAPAASTAKAPSKDAPKAGSRGRTRILLVDDHPMMRQGLAALIGGVPELCICGEAENAAEAIAAVAASPPDLVLADITLPDKNGLELIKDLHALRPGLRVLVVSMHDEAIYAERVLRAGGRGYIMKQEGGRKMLDAIRVVLAGQIYVSERMSSLLLELLSGTRGNGGASPVTKLTDREFEVFQLIGRGLATRVIAERLHLSIKTVEVHRLHIKEKLSLGTASELIHHAVRWVESQGGS